MLGYKPAKIPLFPFPANRRQHIVSLDHAWYKGPYLLEAPRPNHAPNA
jgi:hypothetical protein